jgi:hypothetical protein
LIGKKFAQDSLEILGLLRVVVHFTSFLTLLIKATSLLAQFTITYGFGCWVFAESVGESGGLGNSLA